MSDLHSKPVPVSCSCGCRGGPGTKHPALRPCTERPSEPWDFSVGRAAAVVCVPTFPPPAHALPVQSSRPVTWMMSLLLQKTGFLLTLLGLVCQRRGSLWERQPVLAWWAARPGLPTDRPHLPLGPAVCVFVMAATAPQVRISQALDLGENCLKTEEFGSKM